MKRLFLNGSFFNGPARVLLFAAFFSGCAALFGWDIHAPGTLSNDFFVQVKPVPKRVALYLEPGLLETISKHKDSWDDDPQTFHVGEAFVPMAIEAFQSGFDEFVMMEADPDPALLKQYGIDILAAVRIRSFKNKHTWKGQGLTLTTETVLLDRDMKRLSRFETEGISDAEKVFAKRGGPQVNLNAAIESNLTSIVQHIQDGIHTGKWKV
jgi:hypothetical protein